MEGTPMDIDFMKRLAKAITEQFGSNCEVVVHDMKADPEHTVVAIENGHVSRRQLGDGPSRVVLEALHNRDKGMPEDSYAYLTKTRDDRILKSSTIFLKGEDGEPEGVLAINYDITELLMAEHAVNSLLNHKQDKDQIKNIPQNVNDLLEDLIEQSVKLVGKPVVMMNKDDKVKAIRFLNDAGAFLVTKSGDRVSKYFGISKFTLYSYLDMKNKNDE